MKAIVDLCVVPLGVGVSVSKFVAECQKVLDAAGLNHQMHAYGTNIEGDWDDVFAAIKQCHEKIHTMIKRNSPVPNSHRRPFTESDGTERGSSGSAKESREFSESADSPVLLSNATSESHINEPARQRTTPRASTAAIAARRSTLARRHPTFLQFQVRNDFTSIKRVCKPNGDTHRPLSHITRSVNSLRTPLTESQWKQTESHAFSASNRIQEFRR